LTYLLLRLLVLGTKPRIELRHSHLRLRKERNFFWGSMNDTVEKSCWGITLWAVAIVLVAGFLFVTLSGGESTATLATALPNS